MCGIVAIAANSPDKVPDIKKSLIKMIPRGPDDEGTWTSQSGKIRLGHRRLAIVDLSQIARQPMHNENKSIWLVCNGEIYNYPELRERLEGLGHVFYSNSDSEVILHAYEQWGDESIEYFEGMYAYILWDENNGRLLAVKDRIGIKPLCYAEIPGGIAIASEMDSLIQVLPFRPEVNPEAVAYAMSIRYVPSPHAIWKGVKKLEPGHFLTWDEKRGANIYCYWSPPAEINYIGDYSPDKWNELFEKVLNEHLLSDVPIGIFLSGGIDSTSIAAGLQNIGYRPKALTVSFPEYKDNEATVAQETAKVLNLDHEIIEIRVKDIDDYLNKIYDLYDEPHCNYGLIPMYLISQTAKKYFKTVFAGDGGDECFGGYSWYRENLNYYPRFLSHLTEIVKKILNTRSFPIYNFLKLNYLNFSPIQAYSWKISTRFFPEELEYLMSPSNLYFDHKKRIEPFERHFIKNMPLMRAFQRVDLLTFCSEMINPKIDRSSMGHSLEVRVPFLDRRIIEWALSRPFDQVEKKPEESKPILRQYLRSFNLNNIFKLPKQGFGLKVAKHYDQSKALDQIAESWFVKSGFWSKDWKRIISANIPGKSFRIWSALMLAKWAEKKLN